MFIFPGVGFAAVSVRAKYVPDSFFIVAARALAEVVPEEDARSGTIYPSVSIIRDISRRVAWRWRNTRTRSRWLSSTRNPVTWTRSSPSACTFPWRTVRCE